MRDMILRKASAALNGRPVILWRAVRGGRLVVDAASGPLSFSVDVDGDVAKTLRAWGLALSDGTRWVASQCNGDGWQVARVRADLPAPSPNGVESRRADRLTLELAGLVLGGLERSVAASDQTTVYLCSAASVLDSCLGRVRDAAGLTTAMRAHLLADLAHVATAIEDALRAA